MKDFVFSLFVFFTFAGTVSADEYLDPHNKIIYTYEPSSGIAMVKSGYEEIIDYGYGYEREVVFHSGNPNASDDVTILDSFTIGTEEYVVTSIGDLAFYNNRSIKTVNIPETVTNIGDWAFYSCDSLTAVHLPEGLTRIANSLFYSCRQLVSVNIPSSVIAIEHLAFCNCNSLTSLTLPANLSFIGRSAFYGTPWYDTQYDEAPEGPFYIGPLLHGYKGDKPTGELVIREGTTQIGYQAFSNCNDLTAVTFPSSVAYVDNYAFQNCTNLTTVHITDLAAWCGIEFQDQGLSSSSNPLFYAHHLYLDDKEVTDLVIPDGVTRIGNFAFDYCTELTSVTIPDGVANIGTCAFRGCANLTNVIIPPSVATIGSNAFIWCKNMEAVHISDLAAWCTISFYWTANPLYYGAHLYLNDEEVTNLIIPNGVTSIGNGVFFGFRYLTNVTIPEGVTSIGEHAFDGCSGLTSISLPLSLSSMGIYAFRGCSSLTHVNIPKGITCISGSTFSECSRLTTVTIPASVNSIDNAAFWGCWDLESVISWIEEPFEIMDNVFGLYDDKTNVSSLTSATLYVPKGTVDKYKATKGWNVFSSIIENTEPDDNIAYRPFIEEGKVWKVGDDSGNPVQRVEYYYFDGDTIIDGKTCKQMMCQQFVNLDHPSYNYLSQLPSSSYVGAWYEADKKVYFYNALSKQFRLWYDFSINANDTVQFNNQPYIVGPKQTGGIKGFKGVYRDVMMPWEGEQNIHNSTWLEGVGNIEGPIYNVYYGKEYHELFLMSCTVGDEVIYFNDDYEDGATPAEARKRFDFTHTIKTQPKAPRKWTGARASSPAEADQSLYGEYNNLQLGINLDPLVDAYLVRITDESGKVVYEKAINAGSIVGLNIDISAYAAGRYTVTVENAQESFTGEFETQTSGISDALRPNNNEVIKRNVYNLQGQRISSLQKGLNIVNGQKIYVK